MHKPLLTLSLLALAIQAHAGSIRPVVTATPEAGRYTAVQNVKLNVGSPSSVVYFTTDGSLPSKRSPRYQGQAIQVIDRLPAGHDMLIRTLTYDANGNGARHTFAYLIKSDNQAPIVTASVAGGDYLVAQSITLSVTDDQDKAPVLYFTTDGSLPSKNSPRYQGQPLLAKDVKSQGTDLYIKALAYDASGNAKRYTFTYKIEAQSQPKLAKNVILMISDGTSWNSWEMAANYQQGVKANELAIYKQMPVRLGMTTFPLNTSNNPTNDDIAVGSYDAAKAWDPKIGTPWDEKYKTAIEGYKYLRTNVTDSAAAGSAMASGHKTYNNAINYDNHGKPLPFVTKALKQAGKATGVVTSVQFSHATPAAFATNDLSRKNMQGIASSMLLNNAVDLIMGTGHPDFDGNGTDLTKLNSTQCAASWACQNRFDTVSEQTWQQLKAGTLKASGASATWTLLEEKADFELLAANNLKVAGPLIGVPKVRWTLQQGREEAVLGKDPSQPSGVRKIASVPDLATLSEGALNYLAKDKDGFFMMIEGGAVDWAAHANQSDRIIEEGMDFNAAVAKVQAWVEKNSSWDETLLIITTDHGNGLPLSPASDSVAFDAVKNAGQGNVPQARYWTDQHTNEIVRLWAKGAGSQFGAAYVRGVDPEFAKVVGQNQNGAYIDNTDIANWIYASLNGAASGAVSSAQPN